jgi:hypothetical protein
VFEALFNHPLWAYKSGTFAFASAWPLWVLFALLIAGGALIALTLARRKALGWRRLALLGTLQYSMLGLVLALLWRPVLNVERVRDRENVLAVALDASASMAVAGESGNSRLQEAVSALQQGPLDSLRKVFDVRLFSFARDTEPLSSITAVPPPGPQTLIGDALLQVLQTAGSVPLAGVVLLSDGAENGDTLSEDRLKEIASYGVPVHTVGVGPLRNPDDLELERIDVPAAAPAGATITAEVAIRHDAAGNTRLRVYDQDRLLATREVTLPADAELTRFSVELPAGSPGTRDLRFQVDPLPGETNTQNNNRNHVISVPPGRRSILYIEGEPRWEYKFLRRALESDRSLRLVSVLRTTPNKYFRQGVTDPGELVDGFPKDAATLFAYDAIIIGSFEASTLSSEQHRILKEFVDTRGGSVLLLAGNSGLSSGGWEDTALAQALPTRLPDRQGAKLNTKSVRPMPTLYGEEFSITRFDPDSKRNLDSWRTLPELADAQSLGPVRPGAIVLLQTQQERGPTPLLVWQRYGRGATYLLGTGSTLRWRMRAAPEDQRHGIFWRQFAHALADHTPGRVTINTTRTVYDDERRVVLEAEVRNELFEPVNNASVELLVAPERDPSYVVRMQPSGGGDGRYIANFDAQGSGLYRIDLTASQAGRELGVVTTHVRRNDGALEYFGTRQNRPVLQRLADMTGGRYWTLDDLSGLTAAIPYSKAGILERQALELWNLPIVFILLLALKSCEWLLRLRWGRL